ncbi:MAG: cyclic pyranopterin monophosphate synthase MoaC [Desulfobacteraceae bacterium]|nr:cyclic pyranopterin monophosphate synthase MoaC [Desulfobacteraceae bacterium]
MKDFSHLDEKGRVRMVDVTAKIPSDRIALAQAIIHMQPETFELIQSGPVKKGNVLETARIAGVMASKQTCALIPMCHPLNLTHAKVDFFLEACSHTIRIEAQARVVAHTGVEMEALTAATVAALTIYDMCKSYDRQMRITDVCLLEKRGGKSGNWKKD